MKSGQKVVPVAPSVALPRFRPVNKRIGPAFYDGLVNVCPGCDKSHWHVGRSSAECAFCETALPIVRRNNSNLFN